MRALLVLALVFAPGLARAQSDCIALAANAPSVIPAAFAPEEGVAIRYLDHSMFALTLPDRLMAVTDYNGHIGNPETVPAVVTMNHYHDTHFTRTPDPRIPVVLPGWGTFGHPAAVDLDLGPLRVRNVTTDTRGPFGEGGEQDGNSIFIFEAEGLCIVHLGHLHQELSPAKRAMIGRVDVLMVPVDGGFTMSQEAMAAEIRALHPRIVLPMHWFGPETLKGFLATMSAWPVEILAGPELVVTRDSLPEAPKIVLLTPALFP
ncbi:MBL fold metallo-hydrolase [Stagnihabitans tardus]|uniref:Zn-dependent hydrolase n=1 Tax=Stagnihabitans tardus TaxID=2699202 RepID=A0AAE4YHF5_9RHOB|nr:MBL fold metallo-hydrolase [Stagnihabitans tardus]NBZ89850.1 Zn-dependent hydrolase [Stagnihabitans tardus]